MYLGFARILYTLYSILYTNSICFRFRSPLLTESRSVLRLNWFIFHVLLRCFTSHGSRTTYPTVHRHALFQRMGFPIRTSTDQSLLPAPRGFSQANTSFIGSYYLGIHRIPLYILIPVPWTRNHPKGETGAGLILTSNLWPPSQSQV